MNQQFIFVSYENKKESLAKLSFCEWEKGGWKYYVKDEAAFGGKYGFTKKKKEGDFKTPIGVFQIISGFGTAVTRGLKLPYTIIDRQVWVDDAASGYYNTMQPEDDEKKWKSAERLKIPAYKYALATDYNKKGIPDKGSAIFIHCRTDKEYTKGCIALPEKTMLAIVEQVDIQKKPVIIIDKKSIIKKWERNTKDGKYSNIEQW